ncbi:Uncharacterised protein [Mycobacteroides abscessus subsp. abscessus]|nr:Uncharacterised protein [Mycobacteroides abscessus subsp. abscessus]
MLCRHAFDQLADFKNAGWVQSVRRLVKDQQLRVREQGGGNSKPLLHSKGKAFYRPFRFL